MKRFTALSFFISLLLLTASQTYAEDVATLYTLKGKAEVSKNGGSAWDEIEVGYAFNSNDTVRTKALSSAGIRFADGYLVRLNANSTLRFSDIKNTASLNLDKGAGYFFSRNPKQFPTVHTPQISASVRGTEFVVRALGSETVISVLEGEVYAENQQGAESATGGEEIAAAQNQKPEKRILISKEDAVKWFITIPEANLLSELEVTGTTKEEKNIVAKVLDAQRQGNFALLDTAIANLKKVSVVTKDSKLPLLLAGINLSHGNIDDASWALQRVSEEQLDTKHQAIKNAYAALINLTLNKNGDARTQISKAAEQNSQSSLVSLIFSYVDQADFRLDEAREQLEAGLSHNPQDDVLRVRLAEILFAIGEKAQAKETLAAVQNIENNSDALVLKGFFELSEFELEDAKESFEQAITLNSALPVSYVGLGLSEIKEGDLESGRKKLEQAVQLDPAVSIYRSYLGKAYFEEGKYELAEGELDSAIERDANDPTPYLYRAHLRLSEHKPIEALKDLEKSKELNDSRAVFRSRLLLDEDLATRSSNLGRIYSQLGFSELARVSAYSALNKDYTNYSGHFLLGDLYSDTHLNSRAKTTENLIGRLLVPVNFNAASLNLGSSASSNEFTALFDRPESRTDIAVSTQTKVDEVNLRAQQTITERELGFNVGYDFAFRNGFRENDVKRDHQVYHQGQYQISETDTFIWDGAITIRDRGDLIFNHDLFAEDTTFDKELDSYLVRAGYHHNLDVGSDIIAQVTYNLSNEDTADLLNDSRFSSVRLLSGGTPSFPRPFTFSGTTDDFYDLQRNVVNADVQHILNNELVTLITGFNIEYQNVSADERLRIADVGTSTTLSPLVGFSLLNSETTDQYSHRTFVYSTWHLAEWVDVDAGLTYVSLHQNQNALEPPFVDDNFHHDGWDPKVGVNAYLTDTTTVRAAYAKLTDRAGRGEIGPLEPTYVGGFNQVYDGTRGSKQDFYGIGLDQKVCENFYAGINYTHRDENIRLPITTAGLDFDTALASITETFSSDTDIGKTKIDRLNVYSYHILSETVSFKVDYALEYYNDLTPFPDTETHKFAPQLNYFHPSGFYGFSTAALRYQEFGGPIDVKEWNDFWILDAGVGYEFDKRQGRVQVSLHNILDESPRYSFITDEAEIIPGITALLSAAYNF